MADASHFYGKFAQHAFNGTADLDGGSLIAILLDNTYTFDADADEFIADLNGEVTDASYARKVLSGVAFSYDAATNTVKFTSAPFTFTGLAATWRHMVLAISTGSDATSPLVKCTSHDVDKTSSGADVTYTPNAAGLGTAIAN